MNTQAPSEQPDEALLDREMAFSIQPHVNYSCGDPHPTLKECRRLKDHEPPHAAGYGTNRVLWTDV